MTRLAYSAEDAAARDLVSGWLTEIGLVPRVDAAGNLLATVRGTGGARVRGALVTGSHLDTVVEAGHLDGAYGVVAGVEVAAALRRAGIELAHDLVIAGWSNEEGARGPPGMVGSHCAAGTFDMAALDVPDRGGVRLRDRIAGFGGNPDALDTAAWAPGSVAALVELHIEQGPVLATYGTSIGAVEAITGQIVANIVITGTANHAGTTPMDLRRDAMTAAAELILEAERLAHAGAIRVATCGALDATPGVRNAVAGLVVLSVDLRDVDDDKMTAAWESLLAAGERIAARRGLTITGQANSRVPAVQVDPAFVELVENAAAARGLTARRLPSGAGHDAQVLAGIGPVAMIFVPSAAGVSHSPHEHTDPDDLVAGARVLMGALLAADELLETRR